MIRKGMIFIITDKVNEALGYIISQIPDNIKFNYRKEFDSYYTLMLNDYQIQIRHAIYQNARGYRPEIVYIIGGVQIDKEIYDNIIEPKILLSVRKEPIRKIKFIEDIDVNEFLFDDHAEIYCDEEKVKWWTDLRSNNIEKNKSRFEQEHECTWVGKEKENEKN